MRSIYLAGPDVFFPNARQVLAQKVAICSTYGLLGLSPADNEVEHDDHTQNIAQSIFSGNIALMRQADAILANVSSFRGPNMDPGTAFEIGFFKALNKPIVLYSEDTQRLTERVCVWDDQEYSSNDTSVFFDKNGSVIENFGLVENLMIDLSSSHVEIGSNEGLKNFENAVKQMCILLK